VPSPTPQADFEEKIDAALEGEPTHDEAVELAAELRAWIAYLDRCSEKLEVLAVSLAEKPSDA
jgi:hypothetical protein